MNMSIISSAILFAHFRWKLGQSSLGALTTVSFARVHLGTKKSTKNPTKQQKKTPLTKKDPSQLIKSGCHV